ncbi:MAG: 3-isopropylmalate dehydratase large subunit [Clostridia bacterium]|nr:3-isopropylmalate dehydratase large subunit [Clostridia bacterium]
MKGMTMTEKIIAKHSGMDYVQAGMLVMANLDMILANDITAPLAIDEFEKAGFDRVFDCEKISLIMDHFTPCKDIKSAMQVQKTKKFATKFGIKHFYDIGESGIEHAFLPEKGLVKAGDMIIGADSHTCTYGALGAFSSGVGSTDFAVAMRTGQSWFKVPKSIKFEFTGKPKKGICGKDIILYIIGKIGVEGARYCSMEFVGDGVKYLSMTDRFTISNMAVEAGAKNGIFIVDDITIEYLAAHCTNSYSVFEPDTDAVYSESYTINLAEIDYQVAFPHLPENIKAPCEWGNIPIDQVVIGSCTNGRYEDMLAAAEILKSHKVAKGMKCIIIPATMNVYEQCIKNGLAEIFISAGAVISTPTCGPCLGGHMGILADGEKCVSTTNRNFVGRMGHINSEIYLASPRVAAASSILGRLASPEEI